MSAPDEAGRTRQSPRIRGLAPFSALAWLWLLFTALPGFAQSWSANYTANIAEPTFVALDTVGGTTYLYVSNHGDVPSGTTMPANGGNIVKIDLGTGTSTVIANRGTGNGQFVSPDAIVVDPSTHNLYIADRWLNRVQEITNTGAYVMQFGSSTAGAADEMHGPCGLAMDASGALYISEHGDTNGSGVAGNMVSKYTISGTTATRMWRKGNSLNTPYSVAVDPANSHLLVSDGFNDRVQVWDLNGNPISNFATSGIALGGSVDASGNFWIAEAGGDYVAPQVIVKRDPVTGAALLTYGTPGSGNGQFALPFDVAVNSATNTAYVADYHNNRVQAISLAVAPSGAVPVINSSATASGTVGVNFTYNVTGTNSPTAYNTIDALPAGLSLNTSTGAITGIPTTAGTTTTHLTATNGSGTSAQFALTTTIAAATPPPSTSVGPTITSFALTPGSVNSTHTHAQMTVVFDTAVTGVVASDFATNVQGSATCAVTAVSGSGTTWTVDFDYTDANGSVQIAIKTAGTGITDGSSNAFRGNGITASPVYGTGTSPASDTVAPSVSSFTAGVPSGSSVNFTLVFSEPVTGVAAGDFFATTSGGASATIGTVTGSGTTYTVPVAFTGSGSVQLTAVGGATTNIRDAATNWFGGNGAAQSSAVSVSSSGGTPSAPVISSATSASATVGTAFSYQIVASNSPTSYAATNLSGTGLSLNTTTGMISGAPAAAGTISSQLTATNSTGTSASVTLTITVAAAAGGGGTPSIPSVTSSTSASGTVGSVFTYQITASNSPTSYAATNLSGTGLSLNTATGVISGTPTAAGTISSQLTASNSAGTSTPVTLMITVGAAAGGGGTPPVVMNASVSGTVGRAITTVYVSATNSPTSFSASGLAAYGLSINSSGAISGTPTTSASNATVSVTASNSSGTSAPATITLNLAPAVNPLTPYIAPATVTFTEGTAVNYQVQASNNPTSFTMTGAPAGLTISNTGVISGTPTVVGTYIVGITATNSTASGSAYFTVIVNSGTGGATKKPQTITFLSGVSNLFVGDTVLLTASSSSGLPVTYTLISGDATLFGSTLVVNSTTPVVVRASQAGNATWASASTDTMFTAIKHAQSLNVSSVPPMTHTDGQLMLSATSSSGLPITYTVKSGPATISGNTLTFTGSGTVVIHAVQSGDSMYDTTSTDITIVGNPVPRLINISARAKVTANDSGGATIVGFVVTGTTPKQILIRAVGPGLSNFGISHPLADPTLKLFDSKNALIATNTDWNDDAQIAAAGASVGAFKLDAGSKDSAILTTLQPGAYTAQVQSADSTGTVLIEVYDVSALAPVPTKQLVNLSMRGVVGTGDDAIIGGFVVSGNEPKKVLIRAVGPGLAAFNVSALLADPVVTIYDTNSKPIATNDNWGTQIAPDTAATITASDAAAGAFALTPGSADAAIVLTLPPGRYSAVVTGANGTTGNALLEIYEVPNP